jgi:hypothetical protein
MYNNVRRLCGVLLMKSYLKYPVPKFCIQSRRKAILSCFPCFHFKIYGYLQQIVNYHK